MTLTRDLFGRMTGVTPPAGTALSYTYVPGRSDNLLASMTDTSGSTVWTRDSEGRVRTKTQTVAGVARSITVGQHTLARVASMNYPSGMRLVVTYSGDVVSSLTVNGTLLLSNVSYRPHSQAASGWRWGNGSTYSREFDLDGRISSVTLGSVRRGYSFDAACRIASETDTSAAGTKTTTFGYDEAVQLISAVRPGRSVT